MKEFIVAFDSLHFSENTLQFALDLAQQARAHLAGAFLEDPHLHSYSVADLTHYEGQTFDQHVRTLNTEDDERRQASIAAFRQACKRAAVPCSVHRDRNTPLDELLQESIYADLLLVAAALSPGVPDAEVPTAFIRELLQEAQCPLLLLPAHYAHPARVALLYDGSPASVQALRTFSYLFDAVKQVETEVITVRPEGRPQLPDARRVREFVKRHYPGASYTVLKGDPDEAIVAYLAGRPALVVLGTCRRSALSRLFRPSMADHLLRQLPLPLFVAHH